MAAAAALSVSPNPATFTTTAAATTSHSLSASNLHFPAKPLATLHLSSQTPTPRASEYEKLGSYALCGLPASYSTRFIDPDQTTTANFTWRRARRQSYLCEETYKPAGHNCRKKGQLMSMEIVPTQECELLEGEDEGKLVEVPPPITDLEEVPLIRLQSMGKDGTMKLEGLLNNKKIVPVLIDSGATHNFIDPRLLKGTKFLVHSFSPSTVLVAGGVKMKTSGESRLTLKLQQYEFSDDFDLLPGNGREITLGAKWLRSLDSILWNFNTMNMKFKVEGVKYELHGVGSKPLKKKKRRKYELQGETKPETAVRSGMQNNEQVAQEGEGSNVVTSQDS